MSTNQNEHAGAAGSAGQAGNPAAMGDPADAGIAGSAGNVGDVGGGSGGRSAGAGAGHGAGHGASTGAGDAAGTGGGTSGSGEGGGAMATTVSTEQGGGSVASRGAFLIPPVDVIEDANGITLLADMPGVSKDKLDLRLETNSLTINGAVSLDVPQEMASRYAEVKHQQYQRTFALSKELDGEQASAELTHGVLKIRIPKTAQAQPRRVQISVA